MPYGGVLKITMHAATAASTKPATSVASKRRRTSSGGGTAASGGSSLPGKFERAFLWSSGGRD